MSDAHNDAADTDPLIDVDLLCEIVRALVDEPEKVSVEERTKGNKATVLIVHTAPEDRGKVIGRKGETVNTLRNLFGRIAAANRRRVYIEVAEGQPKCVRSKAA